MPLLQLALKQKILDAFNTNMEDKQPGGPDLPLMPQKCADRLAAAYDEWVLASVPLAGILTISVPGQKSVIAQALTAPLLAGWGPGLLAYWSPVMWAGAGFIPANPTVPAALSGVAPDIAAFIVSMSAQSIEDAADRIATILHKYTVQLQVTATTTTVPPVTSTFPVV